MRGWKNPGTPKVALADAERKLNARRSGSKAAGATSGTPDDTRSQNSRRRASRRSGGLPAMSAALIAPIDTPVTQSGANPTSESAS